MFCWPASKEDQRDRELEGQDCSAGLSGREKELKKHRGKPNTYTFCFLYASTCGRICVRKQQQSSHHKNEDNNRNVSKCEKLGLAVPIVDDHP